MIALQCCVVFCQSTTWISHKYIYIPILPPTENLYHDLVKAPHWLGWSWCLDKDDFMSGPQPSQTLRSGIGDGFGWRRGFSCSSVSKESACSAGDLGLIPGLGRSPGEGNGHPLQYPCLEKSHGERSLVGCSPWGRIESSTTEWLTLPYLTLVGGRDPNSLPWPWDPVLSGFHWPLPLLAYLLAMPQPARPLGFPPQESLPVLLALPQAFALHSSSAISSHCWALPVNGISSERPSLITLSKVSSSTTKGINSLLCHPCWKLAQMSNCTSRLSLWTFSGRLLIFMFSDFTM